MSKPRHTGDEDRPSSQADEEKTARVNDPERTRANIIEVATGIFAAKGLSGARIDEIADLTHTSKRMIYYYFESKEGLYTAVLEEAYRRIRTIESSLELDALPPLEAIDRLVRFTFDYENANPEFIRLVMVENIHGAEHLASLPGIGGLNSPAIESLRRICERGEAAGVIRPGLDLVHLHMSISAVSFFNVSNRHTMSTIFNHDMTSPAVLEARKDSVADMIVRYVASDRALAAMKS